MKWPRTLISPPYKRFQLWLLGASWGGVSALQHIVSALPQDWQLPLLIVQHQHPHSTGALARILARASVLPVCEVEDKQPLQEATIFVAPANYHTLLEIDASFSLSLDAPVNFSRPALDVTFVSAAMVLGHRCLATVLTGANQDGAEGIVAVKQAGGTTIAQLPEDAEVPTMPQAAIATGCVDYQACLADMVPLVNRLQNTN